MERDFCIVIHTVRIQTTVSLYSSSPDNYRNRESFYHVIIPSAQWSWRWVYWFHLVRPSPHYSPCCSPLYGWDAENWECGNILRVISALWLKCGDNAEISPYSCPNTPIRIFSAFPPHFFPYRNAEKYAEISLRSCLNTPIRIFSAFPPHFLPYKNAEISQRSCPNTPIHIFTKSLAKPIDGLTHWHLRNLNKILNELFKGNLSDWWLSYILRNFPQMNVVGHY